VNLELVVSLIILYALLLQPLQMVLHLILAEPMHLKRPVGYSEYKSFLMEMNLIHKISMILGLDLDVIRWRVSDLILTVSSQM